MSRGVELPWVIFGRRIRPFSFFLMCATIIVGIQYVGNGTGPGSVLADGLTGGFAFTAVGLLSAGWILKSDDTHDWGLLVAAGVWGARSWLYLLEDGPSSLSIYFSLCWFGSALGAYLLERYDHKWRHRWVVRND